MYIYDLLGLPENVNKVAQSLLRHQAPHKSINAYNMPTEQCLCIFSVTLNIAPPTAFAIDAG